MSKALTMNPSRALVLELLESRDGSTMELVISIPGREGTVRRVWNGADQSGLTVPVADDIRAAVAQTVYDWLVTSRGLQQRLW